MKVERSRLNYPSHVPEGYVVMFTANHIIKHNGELVMGAGAALAAKTAVPELPMKFAGLILEHPDDNIHGVPVGDGFYSSFKTKHHYKDQSTRDILVKSVSELRDIANQHYDFNFLLNYPAIGYGGMTISEVMPIVKHLPDNVTLYLDT